LAGVARPTVYIVKKKYIEESENNNR